ncbi:MAG: c-type cytochrome [Myxococcaceae bacterium]
MRAFSFALLVVTVAGCRGGESDQPPVHLIRNMFTQEKGKPYRQDTTGMWADGRVMRTPVDGTVAVGELREDQLYYEGVAMPTDADGGTISVLPDGGVPALEPSKLFPAQLKVDGKVPDSMRERGQNRYNIYCAPCHGVDGDGKGTVAVRPDGTTSRGLLVPPPAMNSERVKTLVAGKIYAAIANGVNNDNMPSYAAQIPVADRWAIVSYVRKLSGVGDEGGEAPKAADLSKGPSAELGAQLYKGRICVTCHTLDGSKLVGPSFKGLYGKTESTSAGDVKVDEAYIKESIREPMAKVVTGFPPAMPKQEYQDVEIESLILFIKEQK